MTTGKNFTRTTYLWHHNLHSRVGNEQLVFVLAGFDPVYKRQRVLEETKRALAKLKIRSYALWELIGEHDLMMQAWLPAGVHADQFVAELGSYVSGEVETSTMRVESFIHHWMWNDIDLEQAKQAIHPEDYGVLNDGIPQARRRSYQNAGYIHPALRSNELKLFIRITNPRRSTSTGIERQIREYIDEFFDSPFFSHGVVMRVSGGASYLITGRLALRHFADMTEILQPTSARSGVLETLRCRTITHISSLYGPVERVEQLLPMATADTKQRPDDRDLQAWLREAESDDLEFKSSAFTDVEHALGRRERPRARAEQVHEIAKAVVGMLNASGGTVVIGVTELGKYTKEELLAVYPNSEEVGDRLVVGVDSEFGRQQNWDGYQRALAEGLRKAIDGVTDGWVKSYDMRFGSKTVCVLRIRHPPTWYYVKTTDRNGSPSTEFYGRSGGETRPLRGRQMDGFKDAHPRT